MKIPLAQRLMILRRKKAQTLLIRQEEVISSSSENTRTIIEALLETGKMVKEDLLNHRDHIIHITMENYTKVQSSTLLAI
jgi:hypothetical protein